MGADEGEDHEQQPERRDDLGEQMRRSGAVVSRDADQRLGEHRVGKGRSEDAAGHLRW
jgi:hypothetical protein